MLYHIGKALSIPRDDCLYRSLQGWIGFTSTGKVNHPSLTTWRRWDSNPGPKFWDGVSQALYQLSYAAKLWKIQDFGCSISQIGALSLIWLRGFLEWGQAPKPPGFVALRATTHSWPEGNDPLLNPENCSRTQIIEQWHYSSLSLCGKGFTPSRVGIHLACRGHPSGPAAPWGVPSTLGGSLHAQGVKAFTTSLRSGNVPLCRAEKLPVPTTPNWIIKGGWAFVALWFRKNYAISLFTTLLSQYSHIDFVTRSSKLILLLLF